MISMAYASVGELQISHSKHIASKLSPFRWRRPTGPTRRIAALRAGEMLGVAIKKRGRKLSQRNSAISAIQNRVEPARAGRRDAI